MTDAQQRNLDSLWDTYGLESSATLDLNVAFGRQAPVWLEIGFGNGDFLVDLAITNPEANLIGIEVHPPGIGHLLGRLSNQGIINTRLFRTDAVEVLHYFPEEVLERTYILFPDPWPKQRHHKRRLIQPNFVALLRLKCIIGGQLYLSTDCEDYARQMTTVLSTSPGWYNPAGACIFSPQPKERLHTRFETRGLSLGHRVWDLNFIREF